MNIHFNPTLEERAQMALNESLKTRAEYEMWANVLSYLRSHLASSFATIEADTCYAWWPFEDSERELSVVYTYDGDFYQLALYVDKYDGESVDVNVSVKSEYPLSVDDLRDKIRNKELACAKDFDSLMNEAMRLRNEVNSAK